MSKIFYKMYFYWQSVRIPVTALLLLCCAMPVLAVTYPYGCTDYSHGADALHYVVEWVMFVLLRVIQIVYAGASLLAIYSATSIYIKMNMGEDGIMKSILILVGALVFLISATLVLPAFFNFTLRGRGGFGSI